MKQNGTKRLTISYLALTAALLALFMLNIFCGSTALSPKDILSTIFSAGNNALAQKIIFGLRLPRAAVRRCPLRVTYCRLFLQTLSPDRSLWVFPAAQSSPLHSRWSCF